MTHPKHIAWVSVGQFHPLWYVGGIYDLLMRLQFLQSQGHSVSILDFLSSDVDHDAFDQSLTAHGGDAIHREGDSCRTLFRGIPYSHQVLSVATEHLLDDHRPIVRAVQHALKREGVDYVFTVDESYWALLAAWRLQIPGAHFFNLIGHIQCFARNPGYAWLLRRRTTVAPSRFMQTKIKAQLGLEATILYPSVDLDTYRCDRGSARTHHIGFYSAGKRKGSDIVAEIVARMPEREFLVVGRYDERSSSALPDNLTHWGYIADMRRFYREIDLLLVPSVGQDPYSRVILEAAVNGIPAIANRDGGVPEALGKSGILINVEPPLVAMAERYVVEIRHILDDEALYRHYRQQAFLRAQEYEQEQTRMLHEFRTCYITRSMCDELA